MIPRAIGLLHEVLHDRSTTVSQLLPILFPMFRSYELLTIPSIHGISHFCAFARAVPSFRKAFSFSHFSYPVLQKVFLDIYSLCMCATPTHWDHCLACAFIIH